MNYRQTMEYMENLSKYGSVPGLDTIKKLCEKLDNPQKKLSFIHIAGTNGKGSVLAFLSSILKAAGYRCGSYSSPALIEYRERFHINGRMISKADFCECVDMVKTASEDMVKEGESHPTQFEVDTAIAFCYFLKRQCEIVIIETGMGGREDATNIIDTTLIEVFTPISMDHMQYLGKTLKDIAFQKAGIIKENSKVVTSKQIADVMMQINEVCKMRNADVKEMNPSDITAVRYGIKKQRFSYHSYKNLEITMAGNYQIENAALSIAVIEELEACGYPVKEKAIRKGLEEAVWRGRFQVISKNPYFIVDGAHNEEGAKKLGESIRFHFTNKYIVYIMGVLADKEWEKMIKETYSLAQQIITCTPRNNKRAMPAYELAQEVSKYHKSVTAADSLEEAVELSYLLADKNSIIIAFGSLTHLGDIIQIVESKQ